MEWTKERLAEAKARCDAATPGPAPPIPERTATVIDFLRENFRNDGAEGESVHLACDMLEAALASRPGLTEEQARAMAGPLCREMFNRIGLAIGNGIGAPEWMVDMMTAALLRASRGEAPPLAIERCRHCRAPLPDHTPTCAVVHIAQEDGFPTISAAYEQWVTRNNGEPRGEAPPAPTGATEGLGPEPGILAPAASDASPPPAVAGHVSIPRAILERLVDATQRDESVRGSREAAEHVLHLDLLRHEPARRDADAARAAAIVAPHDRYLHDGPRETCPLPSCATPDPPAPADPLDDPLDDLPEGELNRILDLAAEAHRKAFGFGDAASAAYDDVIRREVTAYHARDPRCPDSGCEHPDHTRADEERGR